MNARCVFATCTIFLSIVFVSPSHAAQKNSLSVPVSATNWQKAELLKHPALVREGELYLTSCRNLKDEDQTKVCKLNRVDFLINYVDAFYDHISAQQNVAFDLGGDGGDTMPMWGISINHLQSCAWRLAILGSGGPEVDASDLTYAQGDCGRLSPGLRAAAEARAKAIDLQIAHTMSDGSSPIFTDDESR